VSPLWRDGHLGGDTVPLVGIQKTKRIKMKQLQEKMQELGLSGREAEVYLALLNKKGLTAPAISKITTITRTKSYEILQNLVKKGLCNETFKNGTKVFSSVEPTIAIQNLLSVYEKELSIKKELAKQFRDDLLELYNNKEEDSSPMDYIEVLTDVAQIRERWLHIQEKTKKEILVFTKPPYTSANIEDNVKAEGEMLKAKQIIAKSIYDFKGLNGNEIQNLIRIIEAYEEIGEQARIIYDLPMKLVISDETITMFALKDRISSKPSITTMIVDHPNFAKAQKAVFETYWDKAMTVQDFKEKFEEEHLLIGNKT
jgi:sugar-specific transcriptional regulator TrmB